MLQPFNHSGEILFVKVMNETAQAMIFDKHAIELARPIPAFRL
jgi:hypothetical protein